MTETRPPAHGRKFKDLSLGELREWIELQDKLEAERQKEFLAKDILSEESIIEVFEYTLDKLKSEFNKAHRGQRSTMTDVASQIAADLNRSEKTIMSLVLFIVSMWDGVVIRNGLRGGIVSLRDDYSDINREMVEKLIQEKEREEQEADG